MCYRYETHLHTREASACASASGAEMARAHKKAGYTGVFVTDHFFNGNSCIPRSLPWRERIELFCKGYENVLEEGRRIGLDVFFGFEFGVNNADFLVYNLGKDWLLNHEDIDKMRAREAFALMHRDGGFIVHAHPFRERDYVDHIELFPRDVDGVEVINGAQWDVPLMNDRAEIFARMYDLPRTSGSDSHHIGGLFGSGIEVSRRIKTPLDYLELLRAREMTLLAAEGPIG